MPLLLVLAAAPAFAADRAACDRASYYAALGQWNHALASLEGARSAGRSPGEIENLRGVALLMKGEPRAALEAFNVALDADTKLPEAAFNRGLALLRSGETRKAAEAFMQFYAEHEAGALRPLAAYHAGLALDRSGNAKDAETWLDRALAIDSNLDAALLLKGVLRERANDSQGAGRAYLDFLKRHPDSTIALLRFGVVAQNAGRVDVATSYLRRVVSLAPDSLEAAEARKYLVMWE